MGYAGVPAGHPFGTLSSYYWSATADAFGGTHAWIFNPGNGSAITGHKVNETWRAWCVRGGVPGSFGGP
jgi:hypothetical protein